MMRLCSLLLLLLLLLSLSNVHCENPVADQSIQVDASSIKEESCYVTPDGEQVCQAPEEEEEDEASAVTADDEDKEDDLEGLIDDDEDEDYDDDEDEEDYDEDEDEEDVTPSVDRDNIGVEQEVPDDDTRRILDEAKTYRTKAYETLPSDLVDMCTLNHERCAMWAAMGECDANPKYMKKECAPACKSCDYLSVEYRCPVDPNAKNAWGPGDLDKMFETLVAEPYLTKYSVNVLVRPPEGPWVITMDNFLNATEAQRLIDLGATEGYVRSTDVGPKKPDGTFESLVSSSRTSTNAWCQHECYQDEIARGVVDRISDVTGIDEINSEYLQMLRYEPGEYYKSHHDYIPHDRNRQQGVRILTVYLYLNDVPAGGGTNFPKLGDAKNGGLTVLPQRGRVLIWPSVKNEDPNSKDWRTTHQALPVEEGVKYGANAWFHMRDFKTPNKNGCQ